MKHTVNSPSQTQFHHVRRFFIRMTASGVTRSSTFSVKSALRLVGAVLFLLFSLSEAGAQTGSVTDGTTPGALTPGTPAGSYALSGFDNVNLFNGNLNFNLPLGSVSGRGGVQVPLSLLIERHWRVERSIIAGTNPPSETDYPIYDDWVYRPYLQQGRLTLRTQGDNLTYCDPNGGPTWDPSAYTQTLTRLTWTAFDGTEYELIDQANGGRVARNGQCIDPEENYRFRGTVFKSADGSEITFLADGPIVDSPWPGNGPTTASGYLLFSNGTRYRILDGGVSWIRDRNGNKTVFGYDAGRVSTITDSLNRTVSIDYDVNDISPYGLCDRITMKGFAGTSRVIRISKTTMDNVLRSTQPTDSATTKTLSQLFPSLNGASTSMQFNPYVTSAVWLSNGQSYKFSYNVYGELARVELPTGGSIEYDYGAGEAADEGEGGVHIYGDYEIYRRVLTRRVYENGSNLEGSSAYDRAVLDQLAGNDVAKTHVDMVNRDPGGTILTKSRHYFYGAPGDSLSHDSGILSYYPNPWKSGKEFKTEYLKVDGSDTALDFVGKNSKGELEFVEVKNGPSAGLTRNQSLAIPKIRAEGGIPRGGNAIRAGLPVGKPLPPTPVRVIQYQ